MAIAVPIIDTILGFIKSGQEKGLKETEIRAGLETTLEGYVTQRIAAVNATMQAEAKSDKWLQWTWRPIVGLTFALTVINNYVILPYFTQVKPIAIPDELWLAMLAILGVSAYTRGVEKVKRVQYNGAADSNGQPNRPDRPERNGRRDP